MNQEQIQAAELVNNCRLAFDRFSSQALSPLFKAAETNIYAMWEIAEAYRSGRFLLQDEEQADLYLDRIVRCAAGQAIIQDAEYLAYELDHGAPYGTQYERYAEVYEGAECVAYAAFSLGQKRLSGSREDVQEALRLFGIADRLFSLAGPGIDQYIRMAKARLDELAENTATSSDDHSAETDSEQEKLLASLKGDSSLRNISDSIWVRLDPKTRIFLITSVICYNCFRADQIEDAEIDYSPVISLLSKALELELKKRFFIKYIAYLRPAFKNSVDKFLAYNNANAGDVSALLVKEKDGSYSFANPSASQLFTLGSFCYLIAKGKKASDPVYPSVVEYCEKILFVHDSPVYREDPSEYREQIVKWLHNYITEVEMVRPFRNQASHPTEVMTVRQADYCQNVIITIQQLLVKLLTVCR